MIKVSFSQQRQRPNPKVWNMDCAAAAYHDFSILFGSARHRSINLAFRSVQKLILVGSLEVHKVIALFQFQKAVFLIITEKQMVTVVRNQREASQDKNLAKRRKGS